MRRFIPLVFAALLISCGGDSILSAVQTVDGSWVGTQNGYALSFNLAEVGTDVSGSVAIAGVGGSLSGTAIGSFVYPDLHLDITIPNFEGFSYDGTMSATQAVVAGQLNGSGLTNLEIDVHKK